MRIIVCAKHVVDSTEIRFDEDARQPVLANLPTKISDYDRNALEAAVGLREKLADCRLEVLMTGGAECQKTLKEAVAMGADQGYLLEGGWESAQDPLRSARVLARAVEEIGVPDLLLFGQYSEDGYSGLTGAAVAELLQLPYLAPVSAVQVDDVRVEAEVLLPGTVWTMSSPLPCALGIDSTMNVPRLPTVLQVMKVKGERIKALSLRDLGISPSDLTDLPAVRLEGYSAGAVQRKGVVIQGTPVEAARALVQRLAEEGVLA
jgi:electron transfer flavoprotein beta subunit